MHLIRMADGWMDGWEDMEVGEEVESAFKSETIAIN